MLGVISLDDEGASVHGLRRVVDLIDEHPPGVILVNELATLVTDVYRSIERLDPAIPERFSNSVRRLLHEVLRQETEEAAMSAAMSYLHKNRRKFPPEKHEMTSAMMLSAFRNAGELRSIGLFLNMNRSLDDAKEREICPPASTHIGRHLGSLVDQRRRRQRDREVGRVVVEIWSTDITSNSRLMSISSLVIKMFVGCAPLQRWRRAAARACRVSGPLKFTYQTERTRRSAASAAR